MVGLCVIASLVMLAAACGLGRAALRLVGLEPPHGEEFFYSAAAGLGALSLIMFFAGLAGAIYPLFVWGMLAVILALFAREMAGCAGSAWRIVRRLLAARGLFDRILLGALILSLLAGFLAALAPPTETDALTLHLFVPREYARAHAMVYLADNWDSAMAMGPHLLYAALMFSPADAARQTAPAVLHFLTWCVFILWVWQFARRRLGRSAGYAAAAVLCCMPVAAHLVSAPMVDAFFALYAFAAFAALLEFLRKGRGGALAAAGLFAGFAAGVKYSGLTVIASVFAAGALAVALSGEARRRLWAFVPAGLVAAAAACPFYVRNCAWTGNPVFPTMKSVFGTAGWEEPSWENPDSLDDRYAALHRSAVNMVLAPWRMTTDAKTSSGGISGAIAPALLAFLPLAFFLRSRKRFFLYMGLYWAVAFALVYWTSPRPRSRYYLAVLPLAAVFAGAGLVLLKRCGRPAFWTGRAVVLASVLWGAAVTAAYSSFFLGEVFGLVPAEKFLSRATDFYDTCRWMGRNLPPNTRVLVAATNDLYYCPRPAMRLGMDDAYTHTDSRELFGLGEYGGPRDALRRMRLIGVTHVFCHSDLVAGPSRSTAGSILHEMLERGDLRVIYEAQDTRGTRTPGAGARRENVAVYEVRPAAGADS